MPGLRFSSTWRAFTTGTDSLQTRLSQPSRFRSQPPRRYSSGLSNPSTKAGVRPVKSRVTSRGRTCTRRNQATLVVGGSARRQPTGEAPRHRPERGRRVHSPQRMRSESCRVVMWTPALLGQGGAEPRPVWAKAMEGVKSLEMQRRRTSRRRGSGMWTRLLVKLERPS